MPVPLSLTWVMYGLSAYDWTIDHGGGPFEESPDGRVTFGTPHAGPALEYQKILAEVVAEHREEFGQLSKPGAEWPGPFRDLSKRVGLEAHRRWREVELRYRRRCLAARIWILWGVMLLVPVLSWALVRWATSLRRSQGGATAPTAS